MKKLVDIMKAIGNWFALLVGADCNLRKEAVDEGLCDFGGQGKDKYGK